MAHGGQVCGRLVDSGDACSRTIGLIVEQDGIDDRDHR